MTMLTVGSKSGGRPTWCMHAPAHGDRGVTGRASVGGATQSALNGRPIGHPRPRYSPWPAATPGGPRRVVVGGATDAPGTRNDGGSTWNWPIITSSSCPRLWQWKTYVPD